MQNCEPRTCGNPKCRHCLAVDPHKGPRTRALTPDDLRWEFGEAESALGIRSTHGAFVDMAQSGIQSGGRTNGVEARAVEKWRLDAAGRHRCIRARLAHLLPSQVDVLRAAYGPDDWTRAIEDLQVRSPVRAAFGEHVHLVALTEGATSHATRRQALPAAGAPRPVPAPRSSRPAHGAPKPAKLRVTPAEAARRLFERDPAIAGSARGHCIAVACSGDKARIGELLTQARILLAAARAAAGIREHHRPTRVRSVQLVTVARPRLASETLHGA